MNLEFHSCMFHRQDTDAAYIEKPGIISFSGNTVIIDDFVFVGHDSNEVMKCVEAFISEMLHELIRMS